MVKKNKNKNNCLLLLLIISLLLLSFLYYYKKYETFISNSNFEVKYNPITKKIINVPLAPVRKNNLESFENGNNGYFTLKYNPLTNKKKKISVAPVRKQEQIESFLNFMKPKNINDENIKKQSELPKTIDKPLSKPPNLMPSVPATINTNNIPDLPGSQLNSIPKGGIKPQQLNVQKKQSLPPINNENIFNNMNCGFYQKCPSGYKNMGKLGISGAGVSLTCNGSLKARVAKAYGIIKNGVIKNIVLLDEGSGYKPNSKPKINIEGNGGGASAECIVDDNGQIKAIHLIQNGSGYTESPEITIEQPNDNSDCNFCCSPK